MKYEKFTKLLDKVSDESNVNQLIKENKTDNPLSSQATEKFLKLLEENKEALDELRSVECGMIQLTFLEKFKKDQSRLDFFTVNKLYLYARVPFYNPSKTRKDLRVYVGKLSDITLKNGRPIGLNLDKVHDVILREMMTEIAFNLQSITND